MSDPAEPVRLMRKAVERIAEELGLNVELFAFAPDEKGEDIVHVAFTVTLDALKTAEEKEQDKFDEHFSSIMAGISFDEENEKIVENEISDRVKESLDDWLSDQLEKR